MTTSRHEMTILSHSAEETLLIGSALGKSAEPGLVVTLVGPLGAGKTQLVRGIAEGLEIADPLAVSSPTFVLIQQYAARLPIYHFDAYRLTGPEQFTALGPEEYFEADGICLVEWADRVQENLPPDHLEVRIVIEGETSRKLLLRATGARAARVLARFEVVLPMSGPG